MFKSNERKTICVVDDNKTNLAIIKKALGDKYRVYTLLSAAQLFTLLAKVMPDLILLDVDMPDIDGYSAIRNLKDDDRYAQIPVIFLTAQQEEAHEVRGLQLGAVDYLTKPFSEPVMLKRIENHLRTAEYERGIEAMVSQRTSQILKLQDATISVFAKVVESRDKNTGEHIQRTRDYFLLLLSTMKKKGLMLEEIASWGGVDALSLSVLLHDLGKIIVPDAILNKPGKLTDEEFDQIKLHTTEGERIITELATRSGNEMFFENAKIFAGTHHEKWNGSGYPRGTTGTKIPLQGRMLAIADVYDALVSKRPYKSAMTHEAAVKIIKESSGTHFDPQLVQVFLEVAGGFEMISQTY